jgi:hypothetical protein
MSGHPCFASLARLPDRYSTPCRPASAEASNPLLAPRPIPSGIGMTKPTIQQARDRAEVLWGATRPEWVTSAGSLEHLLTGARNGLAKCLVKVMSADLVNLYEALCTIDGSAARALTPADVTRYAIGGTDLQCVRAFSHFCAFLGSAAGDLALTFGATGGIFIAGGILLRFKEAFASSPFRERFERKGRFAGMLAKIPTCLILEESPALLGLAHLPLGG